MLPPSSGFKYKRSKLPARSRGKQSLDLHIRHYENFKCNKYGSGEQLEILLRSKSTLLHLQVTSYNPLTYLNFRQNYIFLSQELWARHM
jgi:hypothetical protein